MKTDKEYMEYYSRMINQKLSNGGSIGDIRYYVEQFNKHYDNVKYRIDGCSQI